jgi:hypothetical protein
MVQYYEDSAILLPEYQTLLRGKKSIQAYYGEILRRRKLSKLERHPDEFIQLDSVFIETGIFEKQWQEGDSLRKERGKYCNVWSAAHRLKAEAFGFFDHTPDPAAYVVEQTTVLPHPAPPFELRAYNALMEKLVREGNGALRASFFTDSGRFMPFAHPTVSTLDSLRPYLIRYDTRPPDLRFDYLLVETYDFEYIGPYILEYPIFRAKWVLGSASGTVSGKGFRLWKRQPDQSLKLRLEIGLHDYRKDPE